MIWFGFYNKIQKSNLTTINMRFIRFLGFALFGLSDFWFCLDQFDGLQMIWFSFEHTLIFAADL